MFVNVFGSTCFRRKRDGSLVVGDRYGFVSVACRFFCAIRNYLGKKRVIVFMLGRQVEQVGRVMKDGIVELIGRVGMVGAGSQFSGIGMVEGLVIRFGVLGFVDYRGFQFFEFRVWNRRGRRGFYTYICFIIRQFVGSVVVVWLFLSSFFSFRRVGYSSLVLFWLLYCGVKDLQERVVLGFQGQFGEVFVFYV